MHAQVGICLALVITRIAIAPRAPVLDKDRPQCYGGAGVLSTKQAWSCRLSYTLQSCPRMRPHHPLHRPARAEQQFNSRFHLNPDSHERIWEYWECPMWQKGDVAGQERLGGEGHNPSALWWGQHLVFSVKEKLPKVKLSCLEYYCDGHSALVQVPPTSSRDSWYLIKTGAYCCH